MTVTTTGPVNTSQLATQLSTATGVAGSLALQGDPTAAGAILWSSQWTDEQITAAIAAVTYQPPEPSPTAAAQAQVVTLAASIPDHITQATADAATIATITPGQPLTADQITAMANHANGWITLLEALQVLVTATGLAPPAS